MNDKIKKLCEMQSREKGYPIKVEKAVYNETEWEKGRKGFFDTRLKLYKDGKISHNDLIDDFTVREQSEIKKFSDELLMVRMPKSGVRVFPNFYENIKDGLKSRGI